MKLKKMKMVLMVTLVVMVGVFMQGCGSDDYDEEVVNNEEEYEEEYDEEEEEYEEEQEEYDGEFVRVGNDDTGYVNVPGDWILMNTVNPEAEETQYCNQEQTLMITLLNLPDDGIDAETTADQMAALRSEQGESQVGVGSLAGFDTSQTFTQFDSGFQELIWFFQAEEGFMQTVMIQGPDDEIQLLMDLINDTFSFEE